jgi:hypothetical protein
MSAGFDCVLPLWSAPPKLASTKKRWVMSTVQLRPAKAKLVSPRKLRLPPRCGRGTK